ncbi:MAG: phage tail sheath C-terminal domain-containing protein [Methylococcaceae bacterium]|nr:phage tail sheath C-terminal domain-containing protein [Methylococcaceae bacterium]MDP2392056.1 phage tail sheath C-terminal domain-containing protein [Methylococcaceae bacterium]MDP3020960.1 phage tail sheath C-terminal domain-containing protein [Methylococcaceae bacterium]MDP3391173.1 phage tail sheath C-terminal domain-containing protein [Methylococcaceae bacterium]MDP3931716.1 phage tail sheath C-terminal domain-containing protein [Methylococcaceae bacterium]
MPATLSYPGVYIEEISSGVRTITGVATSITAFIGRAPRGPTNEAKTINNFSDFEQTFGGLWLDSTLGYAVRDFYINGGSQAIVVRLFHNDFADEDARSAVEAAAQAVADAATGTDENAAAAAARAKANTYTVEPEKTAADKVADAAEKEAARTGADKDSVKKVAEAAVAATAPFAKAKLSVGSITLEALYEGRWGANLRASVDRNNISDDSLFNLTVTDTSPGGSSERYLNLSVVDGPRRIDKVLASESKLLAFDGTWPPTALPDLSAIKGAIKDVIDNPNDATKQNALWALTQDSVTQAQNKYLRAKAKRENIQNTGGTGLDAAKAAEKSAKGDLDAAKKASADAVSDGSSLTINDFLPTSSKKNKKGLHALEQADLFNLLVIPPYKDSDQDGKFDVELNLLAAADAYCQERRALLLVDPHSSWTTKDKARDDFTKAEDSYPGIVSKNAALFFPRLKQPNPLRDNQIEEFAPSGAVAGIFARTDTQRGVWKAPAGLEATLAGVPQLSVNLTDAENGELNPLGINCLRAFPVIGRIVWGSRTLRGADQLADEWKYIPVRRTALFIEESLYRGTKWVVFEPNDEPLWAQIRLNIGAFLHNLFRQGAFQGSTPRDAYFVKCDKETTNQTDINSGIVNIVVGFAPLKPAEFVVIKIQQIAGQIEV